MGIIRRVSQAGKTARPKTVIAEGCVIQGELRLDGDLHLDGRIEGVMRAVHVSVGTMGSFCGDVFATHVTVSGRVDGKLCCETLEMLEGCYVSAEVQCHDLVIEKGAKFVGTSRDAGPVGMSLENGANHLPPVAGATYISTDNQSSN